MRIWISKHTPKRDPKFHHEDRFDGVGRSISALLRIFKSGWVFRRVIEFL